MQIHLQQNRTDLALKEVTAARKWAQDNLLVNIAESWVGLRVVGSFWVSEYRRSKLKKDYAGWRQVSASFLRL